MGVKLRSLTPLLAAAGAAAAICAAPMAAADPNPPLPSCTDLGGSTTSECATPGNVQIDASPSIVEPTYLYPWDDMYYGPSLVIGGGGGRR